ncbi:hypothetical protein RHMOL_Rhmol10G0172000 [Rhododendron molle]|uniref:Uncharacterized protein n=1 Tax=Rhododendron molle TaxID=49168 RepID=A0ACC0M3Q8_RHOML|nr:hypothetical protein RHMOL_Rhmol10G0172000 [Rhododendron molle]
MSKPFYSTQSKFDDEDTSQGSPTQTDFEDSTIIDYKGSIMTASPFKLPNERAECKQIVEQVNYTNQCLKTISK